MRRLCVENPFPLEERTVVCLGFFDGVHIGHMRLVEKAKEVARMERLLVCVHTFAQMPQRVLRPDRPILELTPLDEKEALLKGAGVDLLAVSEFTENMMHMRAREFFESVLLLKLRAKHVVVGFHHRFGYRGEMNTEGLLKLCEEAGVGTSVIEPVLLRDGSLVSSSAIRLCLQNGQREKAEAMLGRKIHGDISARMAAEKV